MFLFSSGLDLFNTQLYDYSICFHEREKKKFQNQFIYLQSFKNKRMSSVEKQSFEVMEYFFNINLKRELSDEFCYHNYLINQMIGPQADIISFLTKFHRILNLNDARSYILRVRSLLKSVTFLVLTMNPTNVYTTSITDR